MPSPPLPEAIKAKVGQIAFTSDTPEQEAHVSMRVDGTEVLHTSGISAANAPLKMRLPDAQAAELVINSGHTAVLYPKGATTSKVVIDPTWNRDGTHHIILESGKSTTSVAVNRVTNGIQIAFAHGNIIAIDKKQQGEVTLDIVPEGAQLLQSIGRKQNVPGANVTAVRTKTLVLWRDGQMTASPEQLAQRIQAAAKDAGEIVRQKVREAPDQ